MIKKNNMPPPVYKTFFAKNRNVWRQWLEKNHAKSPGIWLIYYKRSSGKSSVSYNEAVEEALCFGWIDSLPRKLDDKKAMWKFTPRKTKSAWSELNKKRIENLLRKGLITNAGLMKIEASKKDGSWHILTASNTAVETNQLPVDLVKAFSKNKKALTNFKAFPPGYRRRFLFWIDSAKLPKTRMARVKQTVLMAAANKKPGIKGFKL